MIDIKIGSTYEMKKPRKGKTCLPRRVLEIEEGHGHFGGRVKSVTVLETTEGPPSWLSLRWFQDNVEGEKR